MSDLDLAPEQIASWARGLGDVAAEYAPSVLGGLGVLLLGWLVAKLVRSALQRMLKAARLDTAVQGTRIQSLLSAINKDLGRASSCRWSSRSCSRGWSKGR